MTRFIHDQFAKDYLEQALSPYGEIQAPRRVAGEVREIDVWFVPRQPPDVTRLGLLGKIAQTITIFEPYRNPATPDEICDCLLKHLEMRGSLQREAKRNKIKLSKSDLPYLWIITPTASPAIISGFSVSMKKNWGSGIYFFPLFLRSRLIVIHQLPCTPETVWLRVLGKGKVQEQAIDEIEALPQEHPLGLNTLELFYQLQEDLKNTENPDKEDRELIMRLKPLFQEKLAEAEQKGIEQGERRVVESLLRNRFGSLDAELTAIIEPLLSLPLEESTSLLMQVSREELIARFSSHI